MGRGTGCRAGEAQWRHDTLRPGAVALDAQRGPAVTEDAQAAEALRAVYAGILERAPEHDFSPTLDRVQQVCELLGDPQLAYRVVHVTGTNGKTSTTRMIERLVREHGLRTGRFTSPHLTSVTERIAIEVGMGGSWDATNVVQPDVTVITPVAMDHERWLGHDLVDIAGEKAGIVKEGAPLVLAEQEPNADGVILAAAAERGVRVLREGVDLEVAAREVAVGGQVISLRTGGGLYTEVFLPLHGLHQARNALLALAATELLMRGGSALAGDVVEVAMADVDSPGRLEVVRRSPTVLVDAAHNPAGAEALVAAIQEAFDFERLVGVVGILEDKNAEHILSVLEPLLDEIVVTRSSSARALDVSVLGELAVEVFGEDRVYVAERLDEALTRAVDLAESAVLGSPTGAGVLVTGSITVVAEARVLIGRARRGS